MRRIQRRQLWLSVATSDSVVADRLLSQQDLDLTGRQRTSLYPWRGQFSPELVANLLGRYARPGDVVLDPFAGSGTVLFEAARCNLEAHAIEINPVAILFSRVGGFCALDGDARAALLAGTRKRLKKLRPGELDGSRRLESVLGGLAPSSLEYVTVATSALLAMRNSPRLDIDGLSRAHAKNEELIMGLPFARRRYETHMSDARSAPLDDASIDLILTSPPYINVFNYHQHFRSGVEALGWLPLTIAGSEIGANRKHRGNRFKTVVQYCIDMAGALAEMNRVLRDGARAVVVVGYESRVCGLRFYNAALLSALASLAGFSIEAEQQRRFVSRFGTSIREDLLTLRKSEQATDRVDEAREVGVAALRLALDGATESTLEDVQAAIDGAEVIYASPLADFARATPALVSQSP